MAVSYCIPTNSSWEFLLLHVLVSIWCQCFGFCHSSRYVVIVYCCFFHLQFSNDIWWISSYSFNSVFCWTEILNFSQVQITQCFFHGLYFGVVSNTSLPNPRSVSPVLSSMCFTVLYLGSLSILRKYLWKVWGLYLDHVFFVCFPCCAACRILVPKPRILAHIPCSGSRES